MTVNEDGNIELISATDVTERHYYRQGDGSNYRNDVLELDTVESESLEE